jgi:TPR repeat protein
MPIKLICCMSLPPATASSVPTYDFAISNEELAKKSTEAYFPCCGKSICEGCVHSFCKSGNDDKCPFCNSDRGGKTDGELVAEIMKRVAANDAASINLLAGFYYHGINGIQQDQTEAMELYARSAGLGCGLAHNNLANVHHKGGNMKKSKFHYEAAAMAGHEEARCSLGYVEERYGNVEQAIKHWTIAASAGDYKAMHVMRTQFEQGLLSRDTIDSTLTAYNNSCAETRSEARDAYIRDIIE